MIGMLAFPLFDEGGKRVDFDYTGDAGVVGNQLRIVSGRSHVRDFTIAQQPTPESVQWVEGFEKARSQKRRRLPKIYTDSWHSGWLAGWRRNDEEKERGW
jgi:hypothetical protein